MLMNIVLMQNPGKTPLLLVVPEQTGLCPLSAVLLEARNRQTWWLLPTLVSIRMWHALGPSFLVFFLRLGVLYTVGCLRAGVTGSCVTTRIIWESRTGGFQGSDLPLIKSRPMWSQTKKTKQSPTGVMRLESL